MNTRTGISLLRFALLASMLGIAPTLASADTSEVVVQIDGLRSDRGEVRGALFHSPEGWTDEGREVATCHAEIRGHHATCVMTGVAPGTYAFAFLHDENDNGALDRDFIGWPQEGFGFSNDAAPGLGPPSYESARFAHDGIETELHVHARYGL